MDINELKELLELISEKDIHEFELEEEGVKLKIKKGLPGPGNSTNNHPPVPAPAVVSPPIPVTVPEPVELEDEGVVSVLSPMVGTFFRSPEPGAAPFVSVGDPVKKGQVLCIIEAMKLMNEIESDYSGELVEVCPENGAPVQYGDKLFSIRVTS